MAVPSHFSAHKIAKWRAEQNGIVIGVAMPMRACGNCLHWQGPRIRSDMRRHLCADQGPCAQDEQGGERQLGPTDNLDCQQWKHAL
jgi:hypothetical protein